MLNETFYLDGVDARSAGIYLQSPVSFSEAVPVVEAQTIPGRNGDILFYTGSYENRSGSASCFCLQKDVEKAVSSAGKFLTEKRGYRRLETSNDPDHYWMARVENSPQIAMRLRTLAPFEIGFDCKPQRFLKSGESPVVFTSNGSMFNGSIFNPYGQAALPLVVVYFRGLRCVIEIGDKRVILNSMWYEESYLDAELQKKGISIEQLKKNLFTIGVSDEEFWRALDDCQGSSQFFINSIEEYANEYSTSEDISNALFLNASEYESVFSAVIAGDWLSVLYLDSDTQNAYNDYGNQNRNISAELFPVLQDGENNIILSRGVEKVEIVPRWWEI
jgi:phage-related protein